MTMMRNDGGDDGETSNGIFSPMASANAAPYLAHGIALLRMALRQLQEGANSLITQGNNRDTVSEIGLADTTLATSWLSGRMPADRKPALLPVIDHRHVDGLPTDYDLPDARWNGPFSAVELEIINDQFCVSGGHLPSLPDWPVQ